MHKTGKIAVEKVKNNPDNKIKILKYLKILLTLFNSNTITDVIKHGAMPGSTKKCENRGKVITFV